ncbi:carbon-nitrogen family hydrolase [Myxococcota bacterium]|nr:carbon-nitrogen family hydrolase [Myxococcota bacterium]MBU1899015.1 carbon-nitrogen family hydrolase [Myxococcota bacterium]
MLVAGCQMDLAWQDPDTNLRRAAVHVRRAKAAGARLIALPEMFATGFSMDAQAIAAEGARVERWMREAAAREGVYLIGGLAAPHLDPAQPPENLALVVDPRGEVMARYSKIHPFTLAGEHEHFSAGEALHTVEIEGVAVTPLVCYDLRFTELFRLRAARTDLFVVIANWPEARRHHWSILLRARAVECQAFTLGVNRVGEAPASEAARRYVGDSALIDPLGEARATAAMGEGLVMGQVDAAEVAALRARYTFIADRREDLYAQLRSV